MDPEQTVNTFQLPEEVTNARQNAADLTKSANELIAGGATIGDVLRQKVQEAYSGSQDIIQPLAEKTSAYLSAPSEARDLYLNPESESYISNPFGAERVLDQYVANRLTPYLVYNTLYGQRLGRIEDLIGAGTNAYKAVTTRAQGEAENARSLYEDLLNEYTTLQGLNLRQQEINKPSGGGGGGGGFGASIPFMEMLLNQDLNGDGVIGLGGGGEPRPQGQPPPGDYAVSVATGRPFLSPGEQWYYDGDTKNWLPVVP